MHTVKVLDVVPPNVGALRAALKELPQAATVHYQKHMDTDPEEGWQGKLTDLPEGAYECWQQTEFGFYVCQLIHGYGKLLLNGKLLWQVQQSARRQLTPKQKEMFWQLLQNSEKLLHVYEEPQTGVRQFMLLWYGQKPPEQHPEASQCQYVGVANLTTGEIQGGTWHGLGLKG